MELDCTTRPPINFAAADGFSASASAERALRKALGPGFGSRDCRSCNTASRHTDDPIVASGRAPAATHRIGHAGADRGSFFCLLVLDLAQEILEIFNRDAVACAGREESRQDQR